MAVNGAIFGLFGGCFLVSDTPVKSFARNGLDVMDLSYPLSYGRVVVAK